MKKAFISFFIIVISHLSVAEEKPKLPPLDPAYMGIQHLALFNYGSSIYAAYMPRYSKPYNVQLLYKLSIKEQDLALLQTVRDGELITVKTKPFNLQRLMRGEEVVVNADLYLGHFGRDGMLVYENTPLTFSKLLHVRQLDELKKSSQWQQYDVVNLSKNYKIYIHQIDQAPSFAHYIHIDVEAGCLAKFKTSKVVPTGPELQYKFINCGTMKPLYYETEDFLLKD